MRHFLDPQVGVVGGLIWALGGESIWQKFWNLPFVTFFFVVKRAQELVDSILVQSGAFSIFRRDALLKAGGWAQNLFGEDGEVCNRMARFGYRLEFEPDSVVYSDAPKTLIELMSQQARWSIAYYHARGRNLGHALELSHPRSIVFLLALLMHGAGLVHSLVWPYLAASIITGHLHFTLYNIPPIFGIPVVKLAVMIMIIYVFQWLMFIYFLNKYRLLKHLKYYPVLRLVGIILIMLVRPQAVENLLHWSSKWKEYNKESLADLRREVRRNADPHY
jgi:cellulose synthase/poly-beta-1,6-N-acetylglucosamine synthase-like glycosyltransferase